MGFEIYEIVMVPNLALILIWIVPTYAEKNWNIIVSGFRLKIGNTKIILIPLSKWWQTLWKAHVMLLEFMALKLASFQNEWKMQFKMENLHPQFVITLTQEAVS